MRILIVEDEAVVAKALEVGLRRQGYEVAGTAGTGAEALQLAEANCPDLALLDIQLEGEMDGIMLANQLHERWDVPVVYLTAHTDETTLQRAKATGPYGYLVKPFEGRELRSTIEVALYKHAMEAKIKDSERRYRAISEIASDFAYVFRVEPEGPPTCEWMMAAFARVTGYTWAEVEALGRGMSALIYPDDVAVSQQRLQALLAGAAVTLECRLIARDGQLRWLQLSGQPEWDAAHQRVVRFYGAGQDITDRKLAETALRESERRFREALENMQLLAVALDQAGRVTFCNRYLLKLTGWTKAEVLGADWFERFIPPEQYTRETFERQLQVDDSPPDYLEIDLLTRAGQRRRVGWNIVMQRSLDGKCIGTIGLGEDKTEVLPLEDRLAHLSSFVQVHPQPILEVNFNGQLVYGNPALAGLLRELGGAVGPDSFLPPDLPEILQAVYTTEQRVFDREMTLGARRFKTQVILAPAYEAAYIQVTEIEAGAGSGGAGPARRAGPATRPGCGFPG